MKKFEKEEIKSFLQLGKGSAIGGSPMGLNNFVAIENIFNSVQKYGRENKISEKILRKFTPTQFWQDSIKKKLLRQTLEQTNYWHFYGKINTWYKYKYVVQVHSISSRNNIQYVVSKCEANFYAHFHNSEKWGIKNASAFRRSK